MSDIVSKEVSYRVYCHVNAIMQLRSCILRYDSNLPPNKRFSISSPSSYDKKDTYILSFDDFLEIPQTKECLSILLYTIFDHYRSQNKPFRFSSYDIELLFEDNKKPILSINYNETLKQKIEETSQTIILNESLLKENEELKNKITLLENKLNSFKAILSDK